MKISEKCTQALQSVIAGIVFQLVSASSAYAIDPESIIRNTTSYLQGSLARAMGVLTIVVCGFLCIRMQKLPKSTFIAILVGFGLIFGASSLYSRLIG